MSTYLYVLHALETAGAILASCSTEPYTSRVAVSGLSLVNQEMGQRSRAGIPPETNRVRRRKQESSEAEVDL